MYFRSGQILKSVSGIASVDAKKVIHLLQDIIKAKILERSSFYISKNEEIEYVLFYQIIVSSH